MKFRRPVPAIFPVSNPYGHWEAMSHYFVAPSTGMWEHGQVDGKGQHKGIDFAVPISTSVEAAFDGLVVACGFENPNDPKQGFGQRIRQQIITESGVAMTIVYGHLSAICVRPGQQLIKGDKIAYSGNTGHTTGPHLHVELVDGRGQYHEMFWEDPTPSDPAPAEVAPAPTEPPPSEAPPQTA